MTDLTLDREALALFELMLEAQPDDREAWLADRTADQPGLLTRVRALIAAEARGALTTGGATDEAITGPDPERVGAYRVGQRIGAGGMGTVFLGARDRGDFEHVAAIKIIKPGLLSERLVDRFQRERQILAGLRHPNIAQLFDGGETEDGAPYIIMEYVEGRPLLDWTNEASASVSERIDKLLQACAAVAFAHANLIVHRDITPSNVLVTASGLVKLIDFGIARPAGESAGRVLIAGESSLQTLSLTPGYSAPERMTGAEPTTAADIYSLGKLADRLFAEAAEAGKPVDKELSAIVAKATAAAPDHRYATVTALAGDLSAWKSRHPVAAYGGGAGYRFAKFLARHKRAVGAAAVGIVALAGAFAATGIAWINADRAGQAEAERFEQVRALAGYMLFDLNDQLRRVPGNTRAREDLARQAQTYLDALAKSPRASNDLRVETAAGYLRLAEIQGSPMTRNLGDVDEAMANIEAARGLLAAVEDEPSAEVALLQARLEALEGLIAYFNGHDTAQGRGMLEAAVTAIEAIPADERDPQWRRVRMDVSRAWMEVLSNSEELAALDGAAREHRARADAWLQLEPDAAQARQERAVADYYEGVAKTYSDQDAQAYPLLRAAYTAFDDGDAETGDDPDLMFLKGWAAAEGYAAAARIGLELDAEDMLEGGVDAARRLAAVADGDDSADVLKFSISEAYAQHLSNTGRFTEAVAEQQRIVAARSAREPDDKGEPGGADLAWSEMILGLIARKAGNRDLACESWNAANRHFSKVETEGGLLEFHGAFLPGLRANVAVCERGGPIGAFGPLR